MGNFCSNCGNQLREGANFCNKCGNQININPIANFPSPQFTNPNQFQNGMNQGGYNPYNINQPNYSQIIVKENLTFGMAIRNWWYGTCEGRCSRWEGWKTFFCLFPIFLPLYIFVVILDNAIIKSNGIIINIYTVFISLITLKHGLSLTIRRLHDLNISGWWLLSYFIPFLFIIPMSIVDSQLRSTSYIYRNDWHTVQVILFISMLITQILVLIFGLYSFFASGTPGPNKYGPPSKY